MSVALHNSSSQAATIWGWHARCYCPGVRVLSLCRRTIGSIGSFLILLAIAACAAPRGAGDDPDPAPLCRTSRDCPGRSECVLDRCVGTETEIAPLLVEVIPPSGIASIAGVSIVQPIEFHQRESDIQLGFASKVAAQLGAEPISEANCLPIPPRVDMEPDAPAPASARLTFLPRTRLLGLTDAARVVTSTTRTLEEVEVTASLIPGEYDLYVEPLDHDGECARPPELFIDQTVSASDVALSISLGEPRRYDALVKLPVAQGTLDGWSLDIVDAESGFSISSSVVLNDSRTVDGVREYEASVVFSPVHGRSSSAVEMVRLTPREGLTAPTLLVARGVTELFQSDPAVVDQLTAIPKPVDLTGRVVLQGSLDGVEAGLTFVLESLSGLAEGTVVAFSREVRAGSDGTFRASLLPGKYRVVTQPASEQLAQSEVQFSVSASESDQAGRTIEIASRRRIQGRLLDFRGSPAPMAQVDLLPPPRRPRGGGLPLTAQSVHFVPSGVSSETGEDGKFELLADAGGFDIVARTVSSGTEFSWAFRLGVTVGDGDVVLGDVLEAPPLLVFGQITAGETGPVPSALIRAYAYVKEGQISDAPSDADYVLLVAEARANTDGEYQLLLPADLAR